MLRRVRIVTNLAANIALVFGHMPRERLLACQNFVTEVAGGAAHVNVEVQIAAPSGAERLLAHFANELTVAFDHMIGRNISPRMPGRDRWGQRVACGKLSGVNVWY
jgi:hypothetical protein